MELIQVGVFFSFCFVSLQVFFFFFTPRLLDVPRVDDTTPLMLAAASGDMLTVETLLRANAIINAQNLVGFAALHVAAQCGQEEVIFELVKRGAKVDIQNEQVCVITRT